MFHFQENCFISSYNLYIFKFLGPLVPGQTHKGEVIKFCQTKISQINKYGDRIADKESYILLWEYLILLLRQKNTIDGSDISELLLKDRDVHRPYRALKKVNNNDIKLSNVKEEASKNTESDHSYISDNQADEEREVTIISI